MADCISIGILSIPSATAVLGLVPCVSLLYHRDRATTNQSSEPSSYSWAYLPLHGIRPT